MKSRLPQALRQQAAACAGLGSPFMVRLLKGLAEAWPLEDRVCAVLDSWKAEDIGPAGASLPLRLAGGLHALVLSGRAPELAALYPPAETDADALIAGVRDTMRTHAAFLEAWLRHAPQTNEVRRSAALIPVLHLIAQRFGPKIELLELGASAGLNLNCDRFGLQAGDTILGPDGADVMLTPDWDGPDPVLGAPEIVGRAGCDLNPLDPTDPEHALRLTAYLWPDQTERLARTRAAMALPRARVDAADAARWLADRLAEPPTPGVTRLVYHTVAWQYFPAETQAALLRTMERAGATQRLARFGMEADGATPGAAMTLTLWPDGTAHPMGRVDFHGRWIKWRPGPDLEAMNGTR